MTSASGAGGLARPKRRWNGVLPAPYRRERLGPTESRDRLWRRDFFIELDEAVARRELPIGAANALRSLASHSNDQGGDVYPTWRRVGVVMQRSGRTAGQHLRIARELGWLEREHRCRRRVDGSIEALPNLWRLTLPPAAQARKVERKQAAIADGRRRRKAQRRQSGARTLPAQRPVGGVGERPPLRGSRHDTLSLVHAWRLAGDDVDRMVDAAGEQFEGDELAAALTEIARFRGPP